MESISETVAAEQGERLERALTRHYGLKHPVQVRKCVLAHTNQVFFCESDGQVLVVREMNSDGFGIVQDKEAHVEFETSLLTFLAEKEFSCTPRLIRNSQGHSLTRDHEKQYVVFEYNADGEPVGTFADLKLFNLQRRRDAIEKMGAMSKLLSKCSASCTERSLPLLAREAQKYLVEHLPNLLLSGISLNAEMILEFGEKANSQLETMKYHELQKQPVHFDLHLGNLAFSGDKLTAIYDFEWARLCNRITELAGILVMCCYIYGGADDGRFDKEHLRVAAHSFIVGYGNGFWEPKVARTMQLERLIAAMQAYILVQFAFTVRYYERMHDVADADALQLAAVDMIHFGRLIENDHRALVRYAFE